MADVLGQDWNGRTVVSTFAGGGGSSTGYRLAGYRVAYASEFVESARQTYALNKADYTILDPRDIREVSGGEILDRIGMSVGDVDVLDGSPPCAAFSTAGPRHESWGKTKQYSDRKQRVDDLLFEFTRLLGEMKPRAFVMENVAGLVKGKAKGYFLRALSEMKGKGYRVSCRLLDAQWLGVPQRRVRTIFVGAREDLRVLPVHPKPLPYRYSVADAIKGCTRFQGGWFASEWMSARHPFATVVQSGGSRRHRGNVEVGGVQRMPTIQEMKVLCGFPVDYQVTGTYEQQYERLGRAVPPVMMSHVGRAVGGMLDQSER